MPVRVRVCVHLLEGTGEREERESLVGGPSFGTRVGPMVMLFHTDPTPFQPTARFAWGIGKRFRVAVRLLGEGVGVASTQRGSRWSSLAEGPSVEEAPVLRFDKGFSLLTTVVHTYICDCLYFKLSPEREGERGKGISHECHESNMPFRAEKLPLSAQSQHQGPEDGQMLRQDHATLTLNPANTAPR